MEDNIQHLMIKELSEIILRHIKSYGMPENRALEASEKILFDICSVLDCLRCTPNHPQLRAL